MATTTAAMIDATADVDVPMTECSLLGWVVPEVKKYHADTPQQATTAAKAVNGPSPSAPPVVNDILGFLLPAIDVPEAKHRSGRPGCCGRK